MDYLLSLFISVVCVCFLHGSTVSVITTSTAAPHNNTLPQNNYTVTNGNQGYCVAMTAGIKFTIPYQTETKNMTATIAIPSRFTVTGSCIGNQTNLMTITFLNTWSLTLTFRSMSGGTYRLQEADLTYVLDNTHFPNVSKHSKDQSVSLTTVLPPQTFGTPLGSSFKCDSEQKLSLNGSVIMSVSGLQLTAFRTDNSTWFNKEGVVTCDVSMSAIPEFEVGVAVSVGIALGAMLVAVVIIYTVTSKTINRN